MDIKDCWNIMKEWKARQSAYHLTASLFKDDLTDVEINWQPDLVVLQPPNDSHLREAAEYSQSDSCALDHFLFFDRCVFGFL